MVVVAALALATPSDAINLPAGFVDDQVVAGIDSPAGFEFAPDGRLFFSERITGTLRTATYDSGSPSQVGQRWPSGAGLFL